MARVQTAKTQQSSKKKAPQKTEKTKKPEPSSGDSKKLSKGKERQHDDLKTIIESLGGDEEDYELVKDVDSDAEVQNISPTKKDKGLAKDLAKFMKDLNFASNAPKDAEESDEGEKAADAESSEDSESESGSESEDGEDESKSEELEDGKSETEEAPVKDVLKPTQAVSISSSFSKSKLLCEPTPQWYSNVTTLPPLAITDLTPSGQKFANLQSRAKTLFDAEVAEFEKSNDAKKLTASSSDAAFLQRILTSGTLSDRLSALTLMAQSSPLHNTKALETLKGMAQKKSRDESLKALRAIVDWWVGGGAPDRKLKYFVDQALTHPDVTDKHLVVWHFEDWLKKYFYAILQILETLSLDPLSYVRMQALGLILTLIREKPEQEQNLLRLLVNKLGDSERPVASRASYHILQLIQSHPSMKGVVVREMTSLILRPVRAAVSTTVTASGASHLKFTDGGEKPKAAKAKTDKIEKKDLQQEHSKYYAAITCNQIMLTQSATDREVAVQLIDVYFELFKEILGQGIELDESVNGDAEEVDHSRYGKEKKKKQSSKNGKGKGKDSGDFQELPNSQSKYISAILTGVNRALPFAKLGPDNVQFRKHIDTLFLITHQSTFNISLQALRLILQITIALSATSAQTASSSSLSTSITDRYYRTLYASLLDARLSSSSKQAMYLNLLLKSLKIDKNTERVKAFVRRFVQLLASGGNGGVEFIAGGLYLLGELFNSVSGLRAMVDPSTGSSAEEYDPKKRDPQYAHASSSPLWELTPLLEHFHPTIKLHAFQLLTGRQLTANADLSLNTLSHFLDRFIYKNPKKAKAKGVSAMQPAATSADGTTVRIVKGAQETGVFAVNDESFVNQAAGKVPVDQLFFHKYFTKKNEKEKAKAEKIAKRKGDGNEGEDEEDEDEEDGEENKDGEGSVNEAAETDDEEENEIWEAMKATNPDLHGGDDGPSDVDDDDSDPDLDLSEDDEEDEKRDQKSDASDDEDDLSLAEDSDADDLLDLDEEIPESLIEFNSDASDEEEEWGGIPDESAKKRKRSGKEDGGKKKKLRSLPTFASYEDYAKMIENGPEDDI